MSRQNNDELPWNEKQWEKMMKEADLRAARFGELLETLQDHPNRDVVVAREMGWNELADTLENNPPQDDVDHSDESFSNDVDRPDESDDVLHAKEAVRERKEGLLNIPAYVISQSAADAVMDLLKPYERPKARLDEVCSEAIGEAFIGIQIAGAKISGGHAMGYEDDVLCGNIVNNKRALEGVRQSIEALELLGKRKVIPQEQIEKVLPLVREAEAAILARINELRAKVWWD